jgi:hypothetical protein
MAESIYRFKDLIVENNLTVNGTETIINTETLLIEDNLLVINKNQIGTPLSTLLSGIEVERGNETNYQFLFRESDDNFVIGEDGDLQAVATREDVPTDTSIQYWDSNLNRLDSSNIYYDGTNVGIGVTDPLGYKLYVDGTIHSTGDITGSNLNISNWDDAYDRSVTGVSGSGNGTLTINREGVTDVTTDLGHTHTESEITDLDYYTDSDVDTHLSGGTGISYSTGTITNTDTGSSAVGSHESTYDHGSYDTHLSSNGTDHTYIDQDVRTNANVTFDQLTANGGVYTSGKDVNLGNGALLATDAGGAFSDRSGSNIDHIWHDDGDNAWNFVSDGSYKRAGNSKLVCGSVSSSGTITMGGDTVLTTADEGSGNGLDADTVDGADLSTDTSLGTSDTLVPSQNAVKSYVDANAGGGNSDDDSLDFNYIG